MKLDVIRAREAAQGAAIGAAGAVLFLFAFPAGSITTLMHAVLGLPGPGAGIGLVLGPFLILVALTSARLSRKDGSALLASLAFAATYTLVVRLLGIATNPKGQFGSAVFIATIALFGTAAEAGLVFGKGLKEARRYMLSGALANGVLLVSYWVVVFPRTAGWVHGRDVPLLMGLCLVAGLASGYIVWELSRPLARALACIERE